MKKNNKTTVKVKRKSPNISANRKKYYEAVGKETKRILDAGGTKKVTKIVYKTSPQEAFKKAVNKMKKFF